MDKSNKSADYKTKINNLKSETSLRGEDPKIAKFKMRKKKTRKDPKPKPFKLKPSTKIVVRSLPPNYTRQLFMEQIKHIFEELPPHTYFAVHAGDPDAKHFSYSTAWINFTTGEFALLFLKNLQGLVIRDHGKKYFPTADFSLWQSIPKFEKPNPLRGSLEKSEEYQEFLKTFEENPKKAETILKKATPSDMLEDIEKKQTFLKEVKSPLVEHVLKHNYPWLLKAKAK